MSNHQNTIYCQDCGNKMERIVNIHNLFGNIVNNFEDYNCKKCMK